MLKKCSKCNELKEFSEFYKDSKSKDDFGYWCKKCHNERKIVYNSFHREEIANYNKNHYDREYHEIWYNLNCESKKEYQREYKKANPDKNRENKAKERAYKLQRTPKWLTEEDFKKIKEIYSLANKLSKETNILYHVDHIIPLQGKNISGLHCPENLQILQASLNIKKHNKFEVLK
jgi:hypothetical protein